MWNLRRPTEVSFTNDDGDPYQSVSAEYAASMISTLRVDALASFVRVLAEEIVNRDDLRAGSNAFGARAACELEATSRLLASAATMLVF